MIIIFSGYNDRAVLAFIRTLEARGVDYLVLARDDKDLILRTQYKDKVFLVRESKDLEISHVVSFMERIKGIYGDRNYLLAPSTEALNRFVQQHRTEVESLGLTVPLVDPDTYALISDKKSFSDVCKAHGIDVPYEYASLDEADFPVVAKPITYDASLGHGGRPWIINCEEDRSKFFNTVDSRQFYYQSYVEGKSIYLLLYISKKGNVYRFSQENVVQQAGGKSIIAAITSSYHCSSVAEQYEALLLSLGFTGLIMVEVRVSSDRRAYMIEANPRFWGPSQLFVDARMNFFELFLRDYGYLGQVTFGKPRNARYFWFGGLVESLRKKEGVMMHKGTLDNILQELDQWLTHDIYKRRDSIEIFKGSLKCR